MLDKLWIYYSNGTTRHRKNWIILLRSLDNEYGYHIDWTTYGVFMGQLKGPYICALGITERLILPILIGESPVPIHKAYQDLINFGPREQYVMFIS